MTEGTLTAMQQEDYIFLSGLAARCYNREISGLIGTGDQIRRRLGRNGKQPGAGGMA